MSSKGDSEEGSSKSSLLSLLQSKLHFVYRYTLVVIDYITYVGVEEKKL